VQSEEHDPADKASPPGELRPPQHEKPVPANEAAPDPLLCPLEQVRGRGEREIARILECQHDVIHREQLLAAGIGRGAIAHRLRTGRLRVIHPGVYLAGRGPLESPLGVAFAAIAYLAPFAVVSHRTAAGLWGMWDRQPDEPVELTLIDRNMRPRQGTKVHRVKTLDRVDVRLRHTIPVTSPARTLVDSAGVMSILELENALAECRRQGLARDGQINGAIARAPANTAGIASLRALMDGATPARTRSKSERKLLALLRSADLPQPLANERVCGHMVDLLWPAHKVIVEFDGWETHGTRGAFETDRGRDQRLSALGYLVIRVTWRQLRDEPYALIARIAAALALRAPAQAAA
jgi:very-short-patch-repair endonuclease